MNTSYRAFRHVNKIMCVYIVYTIHVPAALCNCVCVCNTRTKKKWKITDWNIVIYTVDQEIRQYNRYSLSIRSRTGACVCVFHVILSDFN